jgi:hypothetical protein
MLIGKWRASYKDSGGNQVDELTFESKTAKFLQTTVFGSGDDSFVETDYSSWSFDGEKITLTIANTNIKVYYTVLEVTETSLKIDKWDWEEQPVTFTKVN